MRAWDALFRAIWAAPWTVFRLGFVAAALLTHAPRVLAIGDAYASPDLSLVNSSDRLASFIDRDPKIAFAAWALGMVGILGLGWGGRAARPGILLFLLGFWGLVSSEHENVKAYDRLLLLEGIALFFGPVANRFSAESWRPPVGRQLLLLVFMGLYSSTGLSKLFGSPAGWWTGKNLAFAMVDPRFGNTALGVWLSGFAPVMRGLGVGTVAFEVLFAPLVLFRRTNPWILAVGFSFHLGTALTMHVGTFPWVALCAYPALLHPDAARALWGLLRNRRGLSPK